MVTDCTRVSRPFIKPYSFFPLDECVRRCNLYFRYFNPTPRIGRKELSS
ncbi:hypothetical protein [Sulfolobus spindle-shaped virus]|nr:hypothetical protein [Sulfolobus spindle-shaped virus]AZG03689.1 hypothetical protein [Sulfolobus spindle-shaped virus]AZG03791.1 hypothetical protein [Sulfolobus spindle-shaped virus]AZG03829.1 hypothetical protein [Sulfolobus spindle-shaped virus]AZG03899.1 hypothetical protein [Sulfolobus spindle-shaped virus]